jgi:ADP-heptose:LPS heptosyltransferase
LGQRLAASGARIAVSGDASDRELVREVVRSMRCPALDLGGRLSLSELIGLLARARLVIGNDTGPLHLARAVGTATVTIYWVGNLINGGPLSRQHHRPLISWTIQCPVCGIDQTVARCRHDPSFVDAVTLAEVEHQAHELLSCGAARGSEAGAPLAVARASKPSQRRREH